jgi:hypothetical protein
MQISDFMAGAAVVRQVLSEAVISEAVIREAVI